MNPQQNNDLLPVDNYTFGADGKMVNPPAVEEPDPEEPVVPEVKNGIVSEYGQLWYYVDNVKTYGGLLLIDGDFYYARTSGEIVVDREYYITKDNGLLRATKYTFGADGKMINPPASINPLIKNGIIADENGKLFYYFNDVKTYGGLLLIDGNYYYARTTGEIVVGKDYWITKNNDLLPATKYSFDAEGKMINPPVAE